MDKVTLVKKRIEAGIYDREEVLDAAAERLIAREFTPPILGGQGRNASQISKDGGFTAVILFVFLLTCLLLILSLI